MRYQPSIVAQAFRTAWQGRFRSSICAGRWTTGYELHATVVAVADELGSAAELAMGQAGESRRRSCAATASRRARARRAT